MRSVSHTTDAPCSLAPPPFFASFSSKANTSRFTSSRSLVLKPVRVRWSCTSVRQASVVREGRTSKKITADPLRYNFRKRLSLLEARAYWGVDGCAQRVWSGSRECVRLGHRRFARLHCLGFTNIQTLKGAGQVIEIGEGVTSIKVGDRVAVEAGLPCGECEFCRAGRYNACPTVVFCSTPPYHGTLVSSLYPRAPRGH